MLLASAGCVHLGSGDLAVGGLKCEQGTDALGVDVPQPRLGRTLQSAERGQLPAAYRMLVASSPAMLARDQGDLWDSGRVASDATLAVRYRGRALQSAEQVFWQVRVWD